MDNETRRRITLAGTASLAEVTAEVLNGLRADVKVRLADEAFCGPLFAEIEQMQDRVQAIHDDLSNLANAFDPEAGWGDERHRLANHGQEPSDPAADADQLAAIEEAAAA